MFGHRKCSREVSDKTGVPGGTGSPSGKLLGPMGLSGEERGPARRCRAPPCPNGNWTRGGGEGRPSLWRAQGGVLLPLGVGFPPFPSWSWRGREGGVGEKERPPQTYSNSASFPRGAHQPLVGWCAPLPWPIWPTCSPRGVSVTPPVL